MKLKEQIEEVGLSYKKELIVFLILALVLVLPIVGGILIKKYILSIIFGVLMIVSLLLYINRYSFIRAKLIKDHENEFIDIINYFEIFLANDANVYNALKEVCVYASPWMKDKLEILTDSMDKDTSVTPFINFANNFNLAIIQNIMISIFQMIDNGQNDVSLTQFNLIFEKVEATNSTENMMSIQKKLDRCSIYPLIGSIYLTCVLTGAILFIVGDMTNGQLVG